MHPTLQHVIEQATGCRIDDLTVQLRPPLEIQNSNLYEFWVDGRHLIAKEWVNPRDLPDAPKREYAALQLLEPHELAPRPLFFDPSLGPIVIYEFMKGKMWDRQKPTPTQLGQLAQLWLTVHTVPVAEGILSASHQHFSVQSQLGRYQRRFHGYAQWAKRSFPAGLAIMPQLSQLMDKVKNVTAQLDDLPAELCFSRADPRFANVIQRPNGRVGLIDWEDSGLRDPAHDVADLLTHPNNEDLLSNDEWHSFLEPYLAERERIDPMTHQRMRYYMAIFPVFWLATLLAGGVKKAESGQLADWQINGMGPNLRLRRYLARGLAWPDGDFDAELTGLAEAEFFETTS